MDLIPHISQYLSLDFGLVHMPVGTKAPQGNGWQLHPITTPEQAASRWEKGGNVGLHHASSRTAVLDIDHPEWAALALAAVDIDLGALLNTSGPKIQGAKGLKPLYRLPEGLELKRHALAWKEPGTDKALTVLELRAGLVQDVLPPSIHPDTKKPYTWHPEAPQSRLDIPELPSNLQALWENWTILKPILDKAQPWAAPPPPRTYRGETSGVSVIATFNEHYTFSGGNLLEPYGYVPKGSGRWLSPHSSSGLAGIVLLEGDDGLERVYCHHAADPLSGEHSHDAFSAWCILRHEGDVKAAVREAAQMLGLDDMPNHAKHQKKDTDFSSAQAKHKRAAPLALITRLSDVEAQAVSWLWYPYIPLGKLTLLEGDPGLGKTFLSLSLAAAITRGWPLLSQTGAPGDGLEPTDVLYMSAEDGLADTLRPRLDAADADVSRVHALTGWRMTDDSGKEINGAVTLGDVPVLEQALEAVRPKLIIVDPLQAYLGANVDMHRANEVRPLLSALGSLAERYQCAVVCIRHLSKAMTPKAIYSGMGSIDFAAAARSILTVGEHEGERLLAHVKSSLAPQGKSIRYELRDGALYWLGVSDLTAEEIRVAPIRGEGESSLEAAVDFLKDFLADGTQPSSAVFNAAKQEGITERTLKRAKAQLEVKSERISEGNAGAGKWAWSLPSNAGTLAPLRAKPVQDSTPASVPTVPLAPLQEVRERHETLQEGKGAKPLPVEKVGIAHLIGTTEGEL